MKRSFFALLLIALAACRYEASPERPQPREEAQTAPAAPQAVVPVVPDPHSYSNPAEVRVEHVGLDLTVDFAKKQLYGTATLRVRNLKNATKLVLDTYDLNIAGVSLTPPVPQTTFHLGAKDPILGQPLEIAITPQTTSVAIAYASSPSARALQWLDPQQTASKKTPFLLSQSESILARTWVPLQDTPQVRFTYDATLRVPKDLLALMSAENPQARNEEGVYSFHQPLPIPSYLMAIAVGDVEFRPFDTRSGVYAEPSVIEQAASEFTDTPKMMHAAEEMYGPYRWGRYDLLILPPSFPYGGMENPRLTFATPTVIAGDKSLVSLVAHELAHSWSGNLVTNATWNDFWLNEGVTTYIEHRIDEKLYGREYSEMLWMLEGDDTRKELATLPPADQALYLKLDARDPDDAPGTVYGKGALFLRLLEELAGRERFDSFLRTYFDTFAFQPMTTARFVDYLQAKLPDVAAKANVNAWIYGPGIPANAPKPHSDKFAQVEAKAKAFADGAPASSIDMTAWSSHERVHFIQSLPNLYPERLESLDKQFHFSDSRNSEVLFAWLDKSLDSGYHGAEPALERFLTSQGRRKFVVPLFKKVAAKNMPLARKIYAKARPMYHPLAQASVDAIVR